MIIIVFLDFWPLGRIKSTPAGLSTIMVRVAHKPIFRFVLLPSLHTRCDAKTSQEYDLITIQYYFWPAAQIIIYGSAAEWKESRVWKYDERVEFFNSLPVEEEEDKYVSWESIDRVRESERENRD